MLAVLLWASCGLASAAQLTLKLKQTEIERGRAFRGTLYYEGASSDRPADLGPWEADFVIERSSFSAEVSDGVIHSSEDLRLYPRRSGDLLLDRISHGGAIMAAIPVRVRPLRQNGISGDPVLTPPPASVQAGSPIPVSVTVPLLDPANRVSAEAWQPRGFIVESLPPRYGKRVSQKPSPYGEEEVKPCFSPSPQPSPSREREFCDSLGVAVITLRWQLFATTKGRYRIDLPAIKEKGNGHWRFHLPLMPIEITPLPSYLPPSLPIGRLSVSSRTLRIDDRRLWEVTLHSPGLLDDQPWGLQSALARATGVDPALIRPFDTRLDADGMHHKRWRLPIPRGHFDLLHGPEITLRYFDQATQRVESITHRLPRGENIPAWLGVTLIVAELGIVMLIALGIARLVDPLRQWWRNYRALARATDPDTLRRLLLRQHGCKHLEQWAARHCSLIATQAATELNALCFGRRPHPDFTAVKYRVLQVEAPRQRLRRAIRSRHKKILALLRRIWDRNPLRLRSH